MPITIKQQSLAEVTRNLSAKTPIGSALRSADWAGMPAELADESFFSAGVESVRALKEFQNGLEKILDHSRDPNGALSMDRSKLIEQIQQTANRLGLRTTDQRKRGTIQDFGSERRSRLIIEQMIGSAQSKAYYMSGQDPDLLDAWPAQELVRLKEPKGGPDARRDWVSIWTTAGGQLIEGRMIALKTDPIWTDISRFKRPWPPFDFNSGMGLEEIDREEAERMGVIAPGQTLQPSVKEHEAEWERELAGMDSPEWRKELGQVFGEDQIDVRGGKIAWKRFPQQREEAIASYTGSGYSKMNAELRDGRESMAVQRRADRLNEFLDELPDHTGEVYRGTEDDYDLSTYRDNVGGVLTDPAFTSTAADPGRAFSGPVRFIIESKHGKYVDNYSSTQGESEVLFKHGTQFRVLDYLDKGDKTYIWLEEIE